MNKEEIVLDEYISHIANEINNERLKEKILKENFETFCFIQIDKIKEKSIGYCFKEFIEIEKEKNLKEDLNLSFYKSCDFIIFKNNKTKVLLVEVSDILSTLIGILLKNRNILQKDKRKFQRLLKEKINEEFRTKTKDSLGLLFYLSKLKIFLKNREIKINTKGNYFVIVDYYDIRIVDYYRKDINIFKLLLLLGRFGWDKEKLKKEVKNILLKTYTDFKDSFIKGFNGELNEFLDLTYLNLHKVNLKEELNKIFDE